MKKGFVAIVAFILVVILFKLVVIINNGIENWYVEKDFGEEYKLFIDRKILYTKFNKHGQYIIPTGVVKYNYNSKYIIVKTVTKNGYSYDSISYIPNNYVANSFFEVIPHEEDTLRNYLANYWIIEKKQFDTIPDEVYIYVDGLRYTTIKSIIIGPLDSLSFCKKLNELDIGLSLMYSL